MEVIEFKKMNDDTKMMEREYVAPQIRCYIIKMRGAVLTGSGDDDYTTYSGNESNDL